MSEGTPRQQEKEIMWVGSTYQDLLNFPATARHAAGYQLGKVQLGVEPDDWKPFDQLGSGVREIRIRDENGAFRVIYVAKFEEAIYVLHCFQKKTQTTDIRDKELAENRYRLIIHHRQVAK